MAQRVDSELVAAVQCVRRAMRKCGRSTREFFERALRGKCPNEEIEDAIDEFEELDMGPNARLPRRYQLPRPVLELARTAEAHANPQIFFNAKGAAA